MPSTWGIISSYRFFGWTSSMLRLKIVNIWSTGKNKNTMDHGPWHGHWLPFLKGLCPKLLAILPKREILSNLGFSLVLYKAWFGRWSCQSWQIWKFSFHGFMKPQGRVLHLDHFWSGSSIKLRMKFVASPPWRRHPTSSLVYAVVTKPIATALHYTQTTHGMEMWA